MVSGFGGGFVTGVIGQAVIEVVLDNSGIDKSMTATQKAIGGAAVASFGVATVQALNFESAMANVAKTTNLQGRALTDLGHQFRDMATSDIPMTASALAGIGATAAQLGVQAADIAEFTEVVAKLGTATNVVGEQGATDLARFLNVAGESTAMASNVASALVDLGNAGASTEADILSLALRTAAAGRQLGLTTGDTLGLANAMSSLGLNAEAGGTAISRVLLDIYAKSQKGAQGLSQYAEVAGITSERFLELVRTNPVEALTAFIGGMATAEQRGFNLIAMLDEMSLGDVRVRDTLLRLAGAQDLVTESVARGNRAYAENTALEQEFELFRDTTINQLKLLANQFLELGIIFGSSLLPALREAVTVARGALSVFSQLPEPVQALIIGTTGLVAVLPVLVTAFNAARTAVLGLNVAMLANPVTAAVVVAGLGAAAVGLHLLGQAATDTGDQIKYVDGVLAMLDETTEALASPIERAITEAEGLAKVLEQAAAPAWGATDAFEGVTGATEEQIATARQLVEQYGTVPAALAAVTGLLGELHVRQKDAAESAAEAAGGARDMGVALLELNPRIMATAVALQLMSDLANRNPLALMNFAQGLMRVRQVVAAQAGVEKLVNFIVGDIASVGGGSGGGSGGAAPTAVERMTDAFDAFGDRAPKALRAARAELLMYRTAAAQAGDTTRRDLIDQLLAMDPTVSQMRNAIRGLQAQYGDLAAEATESARVLQEASQIAADAWETLHGRAVSEADRAGGLIVRALREQADQALAVELRSIEERRARRQADYDQQVADLRRHTDALLAPLQAELDALDAAGTADELKALDDAIALAWDPRERAKLEQQRVELLRRIRADELRDEMAGIEENHDRQAEALRRHLDDQLADLDAAERRTRDLYAATTEQFALEEQARKMLLEGNLEAMTELIRTYLGESWVQEFQSFGERVINGPLANLKGELQDIMSLMGAVGAPSGPSGGRSAAMQAAIDRIAGAKASGSALDAMRLPGLRSAFEAQFGIPAPLASGGVITRPTFAYLGETPRARPEIVSPEHLMRRIVREESGGAGASSSCTTTPCWTGR